MNQGEHSGGAFRGGRIDPCGGRFRGRCWRFCDEALGVFTERVIEGGLACGVNGIGLAVMHLVRGHQADPGVVVVLIVPVEERTAEAAGVLDAAEALGELRLVFKGFALMLNAVDKVPVRRPP